MRIAGSIKVVAKGANASWDYPNTTLAALLKLTHAIAHNLDGKLKDGEVTVVFRLL